MLQFINYLFIYSLKITLHALFLKMADGEKEEDGERAGREEGRKNGQIFLHYQQRREGRKEEMFGKILLSSFLPFFPFFPPRWRV